MANQSRLICNACLVAACIYGFVSGSVSGKTFGIISLVLFGVGGTMVVVEELVQSNNQQLKKINAHVQRIKSLTALDCLTVEICISAGSVDPMMAYLLLIPSVVDNIMTLATNDWSIVTPWAHILDCVLFFVFAFKDSKFILVPGGIFFLLGILTDRDNDGYLALFEAFGVFCGASCIGGKDLKDFGIPIGG